MRPWKSPPMEWIEKVIRIDSTTFKSNEALVRYLVPLLTEIGLRVQEHRVVENGVTFKNLLAFSHSPTAKDLVVFNTHLDTVTTGERALWTKTGGNPFKATRVRNRIYGLGTADVKLDFLCKILAAKASRPWKRPMALVGTYGEERGLVGAGKLLQQKKLTARYAFVGEPSSLAVIYAHKGQMIFNLSLPLAKGSRKTVRRRWKGKSAHSSTPALGVNAIDKGLKDVFKRSLGIQWLQGGTDANKVPESCEADLCEEQTKETKSVFALLQKMEELARDLKKQRNSRFSPAVTTLSLTLAKTEKNRLVLTFDIRLIPEVDPQRVQTRLEKIVARTGAKLEIVEINLPLKGKRESPLVKLAARALRASGQKVVTATKASSTEAAVYQSHGVEAIVIGPGLSAGNVHRPNEYNTISQLEAATQFYTHAMAQLEDLNAHG